MRLTTTIKNVNFILTDVEFSNADKKQTREEEKTLVFSDDRYGTIQNICSIVATFFVNYYISCTKEMLDLEFTTNQDGVQLLFILDDTFTYNHHLLRLVPKGTRNYQLPPSSFPIRYLSIYIPIQHYNKILKGLAIEYNSPPLKSIDTLDNLLTTSQYIRPEMLDIIHIITQCKRKGCFRKFYLQNKIEELLFLQLEQSTDDIRVENRVPDEDKAKMHQAKKIITQNLCKPYTLRELAKQIGTNEFKLKKYFKQLYGFTVYAYITQLKMTQAKQLLLEGELSITSIAEKLGYKTQNHFSTAFKKHFGYSPSEVKNKNNSTIMSTIITLLSVLSSYINTIKDDTILGSDVGLFL
ncbi:MULTISPECIES: helix-turn-helix domain-containing protein [unclassified Myroides]|uniref:helix-turn-helix domain-containing protein n=1 Tax=unclassified Myroides TaxID=2642485 RepID=UPI003D2F832D